MKKLTLRKNTYYWNEFFDFMFLPIKYPKRKKEIVFYPNSQTYKTLRWKNGWVNCDKEAMK